MPQLYNWRKTPLSAHANIVDPEKAGRQTAPTKFQNQCAWCKGTNADSSSLGQRCKATIGRPQEHCKEVGFDLSKMGSHCGLCWAEEYSNYNLKKKKRKKDIKQRDKSAIICRWYNSHRKPPQKINRKYVGKIRDEHGCWIWSQFVKPVVFLYDKNINKKIL